MITTAKYDGSPGGPLNRVTGKLNNTDVVMGIDVVPGLKNP